jgi:hypothetical protein
VQTESRYVHRPEDVCYRVQLRILVCTNRQKIRTSEQFSSTAKGIYSTVESVIYTGQTVGTHTILATYLPTGVFGGSSAICSEVVQLKPSTTTQVSSLNPSKAGQSVTFTDAPSRPHPSRLHRLKVPGCQLPQQGDIHPGKHRHHLRPPSLSLLSIPAENST